MTTSLAWTASPAAGLTGGEELRGLLGDVDADVGGQAAGGAHLDRAGGEGGEETSGHLRAAGVVHAEEQHGGPVGHGSTFR